MATAARSIGHDEQLSFTGHLEELRSRLIVSLLVLAAAFGLCMWQNHALLRVVNGPLAAQTQRQVRAGHGPLGATYRVQLGARDVAKQLDRAIGALRSSAKRLSPQETATLASVSRGLRADIKALSSPPEGQKPVTLGIGEPFTTTIGIGFLFALILAMPVLLYEVYAFVLPALDARQRKAARPLLLAVPALFVIGVGFGYAIVLPRAIHFLANFNSDQFNTLVQASQYYHFAAVTMLAMGVIFQVPVGVVLLTRAGAVSAAQMRHGRRYALAGCAAVAALLPGDAITLVLETVPLYVLFELGLLVATVSERRRRRNPGISSVDG